MAQQKPTYWVVEWLSGDKTLYDHEPPNVITGKAIGPLCVGQPQCSRITEEMVHAAIEAAWPGPEVVYDDNFDCAEDMMRAALEAALVVTRPDRNTGEA
jgi:hypothetical protein